jgi:hypothetical protein
MAAQKAGITSSAQPVRAGPARAPPGADRRCADEDRDPATCSPLRGPAGRAASRSRPARRHRRRGQAPGWYGPLHARAARQPRRPPLLRGHRPGDRRPHGPVVRMPEVARSTRRRRRCAVVRHTDLVLGYSATVLERGPDGRAAPRPRRAAARGRPVPRAPRRSTPPTSRTSSSDSRPTRSTPTGSSAPSPCARRVRASRLAAVPARPRRRSRGHARRRGRREDPGDRRRDRVRGQQDHRDHARIVLESACSTRSPSARPPGRSACTPTPRRGSSAGPTRPR